MTKEIQTALEEYQAAQDNSVSGSYTTPQVPAPGHYDPINYPYYHPAAPCPGCGRCPCCGRGGHYYPYYSYPVITCNAQSNS